ncbi:sciellin isoform X6 [Myotis daubentonii]|uniref:sciellin isoform X6 n=1 Tax=Myotis daubentonii TaxID=98922 RepID=UPI00287378CC|nr:sciellin isoform X6 [Myotis daubentonii]
MSNVSLRKTSATGNAMKSSTQGTTQRQQGFLEVNKRRTFLQDNSWIKNHPEQERDENYGRVVLNRHNSHDDLERKINEINELKATISRYRSDDSLDRISDRHDAAKTYKAKTLDNQLTNRSMSAFRSPEATKMRAGGFVSLSTTSTLPSTSATTPVKKKRQSWFPPPPPGYNASPSTGTSRREPGVHPPIPPKPSSPVLSPNQLRRDNRQICPPKASVYTETNRSAERNISRQDLENIVKVATSLQRTDKGEELDNIIKMNKSLNRNQGLDGIFRTTPKAEQIEKRAQSLDSLLFLNSRPNKDGKGNQTLDSFIKENPRTVKNDKGNQGLGSFIQVNQRADQHEKRKQDVSGRIKVSPETNKNIKRGQSLDNLSGVTPEVNRSNSRGQSVDSLIKVAPETNRTNQRNQDLNNLIKVTSSANKRNQEFDKLIKVNPETLTNNQRNQELDTLIRVNPSVVRSSQSQDLDNLIKVQPSALRNTARDRDLENLIEVNSNVPKNKNGRLEGQVNGLADAPNNRSTRTTTHSYEARKNFSSNADTGPAGPKDTVVYTRTYVENSKSPKDGYQENISGKYIQTVYSTSDRSVIERDMCTYCRKPLGTKTKMILDELQICCHSTCFKCEICQRPLENLRAGDSIWIYQRTIHCEPCYSKVVAKWIQ